MMLTGYSLAHCNRMGVDRDSYCGHERCLMSAPGITRFRNMSLVYDYLRYLAPEMQSLRK